MTAGDPTPHTPDDPLWHRFVDPPDAARPRAWWHWMDGNIDPAGIVRDLEWLHGSGIRGVQLFDGGMGVPLVVPEPVRPESAAWTEAIDTAVGTADRLGLELAVATSSGWSAAGGPWVRPADAMKKIVWSETLVDGGAPVEHPLAPLPSVPGPYQDAPRWGGSDAAPYATDWLVVAVPHDATLDALVPAEVSASAPVEDWSCLVDGGFDSSLSLPRDPDRTSAAWIEQRFAEPVTVRSASVGLPGPRGFGAAPPPDAVLQAADDAGEYRDIARLEASSVPVRSVAFPPVTARRFRLVLSGPSAADALPSVADGVRLPPVLRRAHAFHVSEFALCAAGRVHRGEVKAGFGAIDDFYAADTDPRADAGAVDPGRVIELTSAVDDGVLRWDAPPGSWRVLRFGASLTGQTNGPAPADSTGLEVDKLDGARVAAYLATHLARFGNDPDAASSRFAALLSDSIESGSQNWTDRIRDEFVTRRGYDPLPWLPAIAGYLVGSASESDRFLFDYRRTIADLLADGYYATLASEAHRRGMTYYAEALEDGRPQLGDDLAMRAHADVPMGAMWTFDPDEGPRPTYVADLKGAASVAHVHGKAWTGSEAFTSFGNPWSWSPRTLKHVADLQLALGVTRFCIHTSAHQPLAAPPPGIALAPFLGQAFTIAETWSGMARPWIDYLARCSALLSAGRPAVEIAVFVGEEAPVTGLFHDALDTSVPAGFDFDYVGPDALAGILRVRDDELVSDGAAYRLLFLGGSSRRMTLAALAHIERLVDAGAVVVGDRPESSPSLADDPGAFRDACDRLWSTGRVRAGDLRTALADIGVRPAIDIDGGQVRRISRLVDGRRITFLANPEERELRLRVARDGGGELAGWDPVRVRRVALERMPGDDAAFAVTLPPFGSLFLVEGSEREWRPPSRAEAAAASQAESGVSSRSRPGVPSRRLILTGEWAVVLPGREPIGMSPEPHPWTDLGDEERAFSGTAEYRLDFVLREQDAASLTVELEVGSVRDIARVILNGQDCGVVWTPPFVADVGAALRPGLNRLVLEVATPWRNRLIAEAAAPRGAVFAPMTEVFEATAAPLVAGVGGGVALRFTD